jgi:hypothetical protein
MESEDAIVEENENCSQPQQQTQQQQQIKKTQHSSSINKDELMYMEKQKRMNYKIEMMREEQLNCNHIKNQFYKKYYSTKKVSQDTNDYTHTDCITEYCKMQQKGFKQHVYINNETIKK